MRKLRRAALKLLLPISIFSLGPAFPESVQQPAAVVQGVEGGRRKARRRHRMSVTGSERKMLDELHGRAKKKYVRQLKEQKGVALSRMDELISEMVYEKNMRRGNA